MNFYLPSYYKCKHLIYNLFVLFFFFHFSTMSYKIVSMTSSIPYRLTTRLHRMPPTKMRNPFMKLTFPNCFTTKKTTLHHHSIYIPYNINIYKIHMYLKCWKFISNKKRRIGFVTWFLRNNNKIVIFLLSINY